MKQNKKLWIALFLAADLLILSVSGALLLFPGLPGSLFGSTADVEDGVIIISDDSPLPPSPRPAATAVPSPPPTVSPFAALDEYATLPRYTDGFELPVSGATGYATATLSVQSDSGGTVATLRPGEAFRILLMDAERYLVENSQGAQGWINRSGTFINLPDVVPSAIYDDCCSGGALFRSSGYDLPGITGQSLYETHWYNARLSEVEYAMPVLYEVAVDVARIQQHCLENGDCLMVYQTFRPYRTQMDVAAALRTLANNSEEVRAGFRAKGYNQNWFISQGRSNHQLGLALDVSLCRVTDTQLRNSGPCTYLHVLAYEEYEMPSPMHELSSAAGVFVKAIPQMNYQLAASTELLDTMTDGAIKLQKYFMDEGFTPLASEWWHFDDLPVYQNVRLRYGNGDYYLSGCLSSAPIVMN